MKNGYLFFTVLFLVFLPNPGDCDRTTPCCARVYARKRKNTNEDK